MQPVLQWLQTYATATNALVLLGALSALAHAVKMLAPPSSKAWAIADRACAITVDLEKLLRPSTPPPADAPKPSLPPGTAVFALAVGLSLLAPRAAHAAPTLHLGPSVSLYELRLDGQVGQLAPGLGVQGWAQWSQVSVGAAVFGSALGLGTAHVGAALSVAPFACVTQWGLCLGPGLDLGGSKGGLLDGFTWRGNFFVVAQVLPAFFELLHFGTK